MGVVDRQPEPLVMDTTKWTAWSDEFLASTTYTENEFYALIQRVVPRPDNGECNRQWIVKYNNIVIGSGFTLGTRNAEILCESYFKFVNQ